MALAIRVPRSCASCTVLLMLLAISKKVTFTTSFASVQHGPSTLKTSFIANNQYSMLHSTSCTEETSSSITLELEKPLGIVLEEVTENEANGVYVQSVSEGGSAYAHATKLQGLKLKSVMNDDVSRITFDQVMDKIINAPSVVSIDFVVINGADDEAMDDDNVGVINDYEIGTDVVIKVIQDGKPESIIEAKVGDNLRKTLLENNVELYRGLKKKLGNW